MFEFLVETYLSPETSGSLAAAAGEAALAAARVSEQGAEVRLLRVIFLPADEVCFYLYESATAEAVGEAVRRARLRCDRIGEAVSIRSAEAGLGRPTRPT